MSKDRERIYSSEGKRLVLVVDDEEINREILGTILESDFEVLYASDGEEALRQCRAHRDRLSLVLLDLMMPVLPGMEVLKRMKDDPELRAIPVIVVTADQDAEVKCLDLGAVDFIPKPYPQASVILARARRTVELYEDQEIISSTERDVLTGLYNREFFYRYAEQFDQYHPDTEMDAIVVDVNHFHLINERFGTAYGDEVLRSIGERLLETVRENDGLVCRREADTFLIYCPHRPDYKEILRNAPVGLAGDNSANSRVRLRMGVYPRVDKSLDIERRFDRAKTAADSVQGSFTKTVGIYDDALHDRELFAEQLIEDFRRAIDEAQFRVYYQPKFDIRPETPQLASAEALVRWQHPTLGMVSPGVFIPLFEENGLIQELDTYVWRESARQIRDWRDRLGCAVPVSVNMSRIDMYDPKLVYTINGILKEYGLSYEDLMLEVTESAYTQDSEQIVQTVSRLRKLGFQIEMDDFGTGYSSLNMISRLPIDALKLDMQFIRNAFSDTGDIRILEVIIGIADRLSVPVIAEGVETEEQVRVLKALGCDIVQGYYFSKPVPAADFEAFILEAKKQQTPEESKVAAEPPAPPAEQSENKPAAAPQGGAGRDTETKDHTSFFERALLSEEKTKLRLLPEDDDEQARADSQARRGLQLRTASFFSVIIAVLAAIALFVSDVSVTKGYRRMETASNRYVVAQIAASNMESGSDYLTDRVRCFVVTGEMEYLEDFFEEVEVTKRRDQALTDLETLLEGSESSAYANLSAALDLSNELLQRETLAMRLMLESKGYPAGSMPAAVAGVELTAEDQALSPTEQEAKARSLVFDDTYMHYKDRIRENVSLCTQDLIRTAGQELEEASSQMALYVHLQTILTIAFLLIVLLIVLFVSTQVRKPLSRMMELMRAQETIPLMGAEELRFVTQTYNKILNENKAAREKLSHEASHDKLTGLFNRGAYEMLIKSVDTTHIALILVDVDYFKSVNDTYGHDVGDKVLKRVAEILKRSFRTVDIICRIGGDEFVVIMTRADSSMRDLVMRKIECANETLQNPKDELPPVSLSVGVAFADRENPRGDIFKDADTALYRVKEGGRCGCQIF